MLTLSTVFSSVIVFWAALSFDLTPLITVMPIYFPLLIAYYSVCSLASFFVIYLCDRYIAR